MTTNLLRLGELSIAGSSQAGDRSWFRVHPPGLAFDVGRGAPELAGAADLFLTHGHLDHALGLPFVLSQRSLHGLLPTRVFCPLAAADDFSGFIAAAARLERATYRYELCPLEPGDQIAVGQNLWVEAFAVDHGVPSLGYHLVRERRRLAAGYVGRPGAELARLKGEGVAIEEKEEEVWLSYCGDTGPAAFDLEPRLFLSRVLLLECTFLKPERRQAGADYKHIHLEDIVQRAPAFHNEALVLCHLSRRHLPAELRTAVEDRLALLDPRVYIWGEA